MLVTLNIPKVRCMCVHAYAEHTSSIFATVNMIKVCNAWTSSFLHKLSTVGVVDTNFWCHENIYAEVIILFLIQFIFIQLIIY